MLSTSILFLVDFKKPIKRVEKLNKLEKKRLDSD